MEAPQTGPGALEPLEQALGLRFRDQELLQRALAHSSFANEHPEVAPESNERLEFLGDALLGAVVAAELFQRYPQMAEGELTTARSALVRGDSLAEVARELGLGELLLLGQGEELSGGRGRTSNLSAAFEAVIGAVFLDRGYEEARRLMLRLFEGRIAGFSHNELPRDPKSRLQELVQRQGRPAPVYRIVQETGPDHAKQFVAEAHVAGQVLGRGSGRRKSDAEGEAAEVALRRLEEEMADDEAPAPLPGRRDGDG